MQVADAPEPQGAPVSVPVEASTPERVDPPLSRITRRFSEIGRDALLVIVARVRAIDARTRTLPETLHWGRFPMIATTLMLEVSQTICGNAAKQVQVTYPGGKLSNGEFQRTELMPKDPSIGEEHVFSLRRVEGEYFLDLGRDDMLSRQTQGLYIDAVGNRLSPDQLRGVCP